MASEKQLIQRLKNRDERAFNEVVLRYQDRVYKIVFRMLNNRQEAEDITQEVFVTVFKSIGSFREEARFSTWLYRIATNHSKNRIKYLSRRNFHRATPLEDAGELSGQKEGPTMFLQALVPQPDKLVEGRQAQANLHRALNELDEEHRALIVLRDLEHLSYQEICEISGLPEGTVKSRLHRARLALRSRMQKHSG